MIFGKRERVTDRQFLDSFHSKRCVRCGRRGCDPAHVVSVGAGGDDVPDNVVPLCRRCHTEQHTVGWVRFATMYPGIGQFLKWKGWRVEGARLKRREGFDPVC